jgi:hypothetical protein
VDARALIAAFALALSLADAASASPTIAWRVDAESTTATVRVEGLPRTALAHLATRGLAAGEGERVLRVVVAPADTSRESAGALPAAWGTWAVTDDALVFQPRHAPAPGTTLTAQFDGDAFAALAGGMAVADATLAVDIAARDRVARVLGATPGGDAVPQNLLRFYVTFSRPMSLRGAGEHVRLRRADGTLVPDAFASPADGLWDPSRQRLTLIVHPGRVKSGLALGDTLGPVLVEGERITLEVDARMRDADGAPLREGFARSWTVVAAKRGALDPAQWQLHAPTQGERALRLRLPDTLDAEVAARALEVVDARGARVAGTWSLSPGERELAFAPERAWRSRQRYELVVASFLEDVSGNRPGRTFERAADAVDGGTHHAARLAFVVD